VDPTSVKGLQAMVGGYRAYLRNAGLQTRLASTLTPEQVDVADDAAIYFAGGHGTMWDFLQNAALGRLAPDRLREYRRTFWG
jgi:putative intracellular protease/amidase